VNLRSIRSLPCRAFGAPAKRIAKTCWRWLPFLSREQRPRESTRSQSNVGRRSTPRGGSFGSDVVVMNAGLFRPRLNWSLGRSLRLMNRSRLGNSFAAFPLRSGPVPYPVALPDSPTGRSPSRPSGGRIPTRKSRGSGEAPGGFSPRSNAIMAGIGGHCKSFKKVF